jgi:hypothetical protein
MSDCKVRKTAAVEPIGKRLRVDPAAIDVAAPKECP